MLKRLLFIAALLCARPAFAAITLDTTTCSGGTVTNCPHARITGTAAYTAGTSAAISTTSISVSGSGTTLLAHILDENHGSGTTTGCAVIAAATSGNYSTQWTLVPGSCVASTDGSSVWYRAVSASGFTETPKVTLSCTGGTATCQGTNGAVGIETHVQLYGFTAVFPTPGTSPGGSSAASGGTPSVTITTSSGDKLLMGWFDHSGNSCTQTLTSGAAVVDAWEPGQASPIVGCNSGSDDYIVDEWTSGTTSAGSTTIGVTSPATVGGVWGAIEICDSTASACPNGGTTQSGWWNWGSN